MTGGARPGGRGPHIFGLTTRTIGREVEFHGSLPSTNARASEMASEGCREGTVIIAGEQTQGAGRMGRSFSSPPGGLYLSVVLRPAVPPEQISSLPLIFGLSVAKAIGCTVSLNTELKWPNDVLIGGKKVCGILSTSTVSKAKVDHVVIGVGINANTKVTDLPQALAGSATTLHDVLGRELDLEELTKNLLYFMDLHYSQFIDGRTAELLEEWSSRSSTLKGMVRVETGSGTIEGMALGIDHAGALLVKTDDSISRVPSGDCVHLGR